VPPSSDTSDEKHFEQTGQLNNLLDESSSAQTTRDRLGPLGSITPQLLGENLQHEAMAST
jgi:hypothetical protein